MGHESRHALPGEPPPDALAELDTAARVLDRLDLRSARLTVAMDERTRALRIELDEGAGVTVLTPTQLFTLLGSS